MFSLTIFAGMPFKLLFKDEEKATAAYKQLAEPYTDPTMVIEDDFGSRFVGQCENISAFTLEDLDKSIMAAVEMGLHNARAQAKAQKLAMADPVIAASLRAQGQGGPAVYRPGMS